MNTECYVQDNWRVKRNFTIDAGVRFYYITPTQSQGDKVRAVRARRSWQRSAGAAALPARRPSTAPARRVNPLTGETLPPIYIGRLVPGSGRLHQRHGRSTTARRRQTSPVPAGAAPRLRVGRHRRRQDRGSRRRRRLLRPLHGRHHPRSDRAAAASSTPTRPTTRRIQELLVEPADRDAERGPPDRRVHAAGRLQLEPRRAARHRLQPGRRRRLRRQRRPQSADQRATSTAGRTATRISRRASIRPTSRAVSRSRYPTISCVPTGASARSSQREFSGYADYHSLQFSVNRRRSSDGLAVGASYTYELVNKTLGTIDPVRRGQSGAELHAERPPAAQPDHQLLVRAAERQRVVEPGAAASRRSS